MINNSSKPKKKDHETHTFTWKDETPSIKGCPRNMLFTFSLHDPQVEKQQIKAPTQQRVQQVTPPKSHINDFSHAMPSVNPKTTKQNAVTKVTIQYPFKRINTPPQNSISSVSDEPSNLSTHHPYL